VQRFMVFIQRLRKAHIVRARCGRTAIIAPVQGL